MSVNYFQTFQSSLQMLLFTDHFANQCSKDCARRDDQPLEHLVGLVSILHASVKLGSHEPVWNKDSETLLVIKTCEIFILVCKGSHASGSTDFSSCTGGLGYQLWELL